MELPIDHYRLLGVSPSSDCQNVLRSLQQRLDNPPGQGFSPEGLQARADLLRASAELLSDDDRRSAYEADLIAFEGSGSSGAPGLEVPSSKVVGGLLLLMEAGQPLEAFEAARHSLQPPQTPALGSSRESDLSLLVGLSCRHAATELSQERHFEAAASLLLQGRQLLQRLGQAPAQRHLLDDDLDSLLPFRVLDLLSRDLTATAERQEGLRWLDVLVKKRGGLEGDDDPSLPRQEFQAFFKQIRQFLTVQEQVDLFSRWAIEGSPTAAFLASYALTASGFAQRKPERIAAAHQRLIHSGQPGVGPFLACQNLLLGRIDAAQTGFLSDSEPDLRRWAEQRSDDPLGQICAYCRDWLSREVLPGYRDIEVDADLDAYFADRDIQTYVEAQDHSSLAGSGVAPPGPTATAWTPADAGSGALPPLGSAFGDSSDSFALPAPAQPKAAGRRREGRRPGWLLPLAAGVAAIAVAGGAWFAFKPLNQAPQPATTPDAKPTLKPAVKPAVNPVITAPVSRLPLKAAEPSDAEIKALLEAWLKAKAEVLAGQPPGRPLAELARPAMVASLLAEAGRNSSRQQRQTVNAAVEQLAVTSRSPRRIETRARLRYSEQTTNSAGTVIDRTEPIELRNSYVFARDGEVWKLAGWRPRR
ncbi:DUF4101 domain-containing protein [Synechococcus sp. CS-1324]|uniref:IMS domain-containing protein n=1 Tax=Synechococcus sp. CS-1324 TaxID=2847980 RepID=UPI000DB6292F|nr:IMS domain-containing protein [Synechococcus sp. CS-1324]MCT0229456.1 DUF4101 domain-containing protein [Synechococcus sp. CS-1324]PZV02933.1 MAG: molecular chaperone DnaJ [Cyanobium sp.]